MRKLELKTQVLRELRRVNPLLLPERSVLNLMRILITPAPLESELKQTLAEMSEARLVSSVRDSLDETSVKWGITDIGLAKIAEQE